MMFLDPVLRFVLVNQLHSVMCSCYRCLTFCSSNIIIIICLGDLHSNEAALLVFTSDISVMSDDEIAFEFEHYMRL